MLLILAVKDTHSANAPQNKTQTLNKDMNMNFWVVGTQNQLFIRGSNFQKNKVANDKTPFFVIAPFCISHSVCLNIGFGQCSFVYEILRFQL